MKKKSIFTVTAVSLIALVCTFLFSSISFADRIANDNPTDEIVKSLVFLRDKEQGVVFSHPDRGFWIQYYADKPVFIDNLNKDYMLANATKNIYYSRDYANSTKYFNEYNIRYFWIDEKMKNGLVWTKPEQGLLFLFENEKLFTRIFNKAGIEIWEYHPEQQTI